MQVNFYATLREIVGQKTVEFNLEEGATAGELLEHMVTQFPGLRAALFDPSGELYSHVQVFVNGRDTLLLERQLGTVLRPEDIINVFPAIGGGGYEG